MSTGFHPSHARFVAAAALLMALGPRCFAHVLIHVPADYPTIQTALNAAADGDEVIVAPGTYHEAIDFIGKAVCLRSSDGPAVTTIDGEGLMVPVVLCARGEGPGTTLKGFTIAHGVSSGGGGMCNIGSSPTVTGCTFIWNYGGEYGGGICNSSSSPLVTQCTFNWNTADLGGGGMYNQSSSPTVVSCTFFGNEADLGGGMCNREDSSPTVIGCTFSGNHASLYGGGMSTSSGTPTVTSCTFIGNAGYSEGGGMYNSSSSPVVTNCVFSGNRGGYGAGMCNWPGSPTVTNCTFSGNIGMGLASYSGTPAVTNCVLWMNFDGAILGDATVSYSDVQGGVPGDGNIDADPRFIHASVGELRLGPGSPCIDAGNNLAVPAGILADLDNNPRFSDDPATIDTGPGSPPLVDMGAYEFQPAACLGNLNGDGLVDFADYLEFLNYYDIQDPRVDFNADGFVDFSDYLEFLNHYDAGC